jgi:hypothetical protein
MKQPMVAKRPMLDEEIDLAVLLSQMDDLDPMLNITVIKNAINPLTNRM